MNVPAMVSAALLWGLIHPAYKPITTKVYGEGDWMLTVETDNFTHQTHCQLNNNLRKTPNITLVGKFMAFNFNRNIEINNVWYKIGSGPARNIHDEYLEMIVSGSLSQAEKIDGAITSVLLPLREFNGSNEILIRLSINTSPYLFSLRNAWPLLDASESLGCGLTDKVPN